MNAYTDLRERIAKAIRTEWEIERYLDEIEPTDRRALADIAAMTACTVIAPELERLTKERDAAEKQCAEEQRNANEIEQEYLAKLAVIEKERDEARAEVHEWKTKHAEECGNTYAAESKLEIVTAWLYSCKANNSADEFMLGIIDQLEAWPKQAGAA